MAMKWMFKILLACDFLYFDEIGGGEQSHKVFNGGKFGGIRRFLPLYNRCVACSCMAEGGVVVALIVLLRLFPASMVVL